VLAATPTCSRSSPSADTLPTVFVSSLDPTDVTLLPVAPMRLWTCGMLLNWYACELFHGKLLHFKIISLVACKRRSSVNSRPWLRRFDDVTGVEKSCAAKSKKEKKVKGKMLHHYNLICVSSKHGIHGSLRCLKILYIHNCWNLFSCPRTVVKLRWPKIIKLHNILFYRSVTSPFALKLFLLPFTSHCSTKNIGFNDSSYVIKPPQPSSAIYGAPPFTGNPFPFCLFVPCVTVLYHWSSNTTRWLSWQKPVIQIPYCLTQKSCMKILSVSVIVIAT